MKVLHINSYCTLGDELVLYLDIESLLCYTKHEVSILHIEFYHGDHIVASIEADFYNKTVTNYQTFVRDIQLLPFGVWMHPTYAELIEYFKTRCWEPTRPDIEALLSKLNIETYDVVEIVKRTHGRKSNDNFWIKFDSEDLDYDKIRTGSTKGSKNH